MKFAGRDHRGYRHNPGHLRHRDPETRWRPNCRQHGSKRQRPGGIWFCPVCYREQQKRCRARKRGEEVTTTLATRTRDEVTENVDRLMDGLDKAHARTRTNEQENRHRRRIKLPYSTGC